MENMQQIVECQFRIGGAHLDCLKLWSQGTTDLKSCEFYPLEGRCSEEEGTGRAGHRELHGETRMFRLTWKARKIRASISR